MNNKETQTAIRPISSNDFDSIQSLSDQLGYPNKLTDLQKRIDRILSDPDQVIFIADLPDQPCVGYIHAVRRVSLEVGFIVEVYGLVVDQRFRRRGLGSELLNAAENWTVEKGCDVIRLHSNIIRNEAHKFYKDLGYSITKTQYLFVKNLASSQISGENGYSVF